MPDFLYQISNLYLFLILSFISITISIIAIYFVKKFVPLHIRYNDNNIIGYTTSLISLIYGVLAGLIAVYLINNNNYTTDAIQREANAIANIYRQSNWMTNPLKLNVQALTKKYLTEVIDMEWPLMINGKKLSYDGDIIINEISANLHAYQPKTAKDNILLQSLVDETKKLYDARHQRINMSYSQLDSEIWLVVVLGTILTLCINYLFGMNFYLHIIIVTTAALMTTSILFLLIALDRPFQGESLIQPDSFRYIQKFVAEK